MIKQKLVIAISALGLFLSVPSVSAGTILDPYQYAWSNQTGYMNFENVIVEDSSLSGSAWSANSGWIKLDLEEGGVVNDGTGNLSGSAWGEQLGWIDFDQVSIHPTTGKFSGTASGPLVGTITFDCPDFCDVRTDWRLAVTPPPGGGEGSGGVGGGVATPAKPDQDSELSAKAKNIDIIRDGTVDILDFNAMMVHWSSVLSLSSAEGGFTLADLNNDGVVDILDFNMLMIYWGTHYSL